MQEASLTREITATIETRRIYGQLTGERGPIFVMDAGLGDTSAAWESIAAEISSFARVVTYDRAGLGQSDPAPTPRTCKDIIADLRHLLAAAQLPPPYILAAHSWSGINARYFANEFPNEIAGMVLIDAVHEDKYERFASIQTEEQNARMWTAVKDPARNDEQIDRIASIKQMRSTPRLYNFPLIVLTRASAADPWNQIETNLQAEFLKLSTHSKQYISTSTDHFLNKTDPALIVNAFQEITHSIHP
jgi:pimeloyl-ACP methyl ester carboxylesterase